MKPKIDITMGGVFSFDFVDICGHGSMMSVWLRIGMVGFCFFCAGCWGQAYGPASRLNALQDTKIRGLVLAPISDAYDEDPLNDNLRTYGTAASESALERLISTGTQWLSLSVYGHLADQCSLHIKDGHETPMQIQKMVRMAHQYGYRILLSPTLWVVDDQGWRGHMGQCPDGSFWQDSDWQQFGAHYREFVLKWIERAARLNVEMVSIGLELKSTTARNPAWLLDLIAEVRRRFGGRLTYSANWDEVTQIQFWNDLDVIGINAFYPLAPDGDDSMAALKAQAEVLAATLGTLSSQVGRPVMFTEVGYKAHAGAATQPWVWPEDTAFSSTDAELQARAYRAIFETFWEQPWFAGMFWWKTFSDPTDHLRAKGLSQEPPYGFNPLDKPAEAVLREFYTGPLIEQPHFFEKPKSVRQSR